MTLDMRGLGVGLENWMKQKKTKDNQEVGLEGKEIHSSPTLQVALEQTSGPLYPEDTEHACSIGMCLSSPSWGGLIFRAITSSVFSSSSP